MDRQTQTRIYDAIAQVLTNQGKIKEAVEEVVAERTDKAGRDLSQVESMERWLKPLKELLESSVSPNAKQQFIREYTLWVRSFGQFYQAAIRSNPGLAEVFGTLEDAFNIQVKIQTGKNTKNAKDIRKESVIKEAEGESTEFVDTFIDMIQKIPSSSLKSRFAYQFERWKRENPTEVSQLERNSPTINSFLDKILTTINPDIDQDVADTELPADEADVDQEAQNKGA
jgi:hypothetical protein